MNGKLKDMDIRSVPKLIRESKIHWTSHISRESFGNLNNFMPGIIQPVMAVQGEATKY